MDKSDVNGVVRRALDGDPAAWRELLGRFSGLVGWITREHGLSHADAADVSQTVWMKLFEHLAIVRKPDSLGAWVAVVTRNECRRLLSCGRQEISATHQELATVLVDAQDIGVPLIQDECSVLLWQTARTVLNQRGYAIIRMLMADPPASYEQVSQSLKIPIGSIGPTRNRCLAQLRSAPGIHECKAMVAS
jgi:RNA polymerase sigma factor (sigma-70 family)